MSASDTIEAAAACPHCGDIYYLNAETQFFEPSYADQRTLRAGETHPLADMPRQRSEWPRIRTPRSSARFTVLPEPQVVRCACGSPYVLLLHFVRGPHTIMLERVELSDARAEVASAVDFATITRDALVEKLAAALGEEAQLGNWTALAGPTRCDACNDARERTHYTLLAHPSASVGRLFGSEWQGRAIMIGDRVPSVARSRKAAITIRGDRGSWGCRCGAGPAGYVARFERDGSHLVLVDLALTATDAT